MPLRNSKAFILGAIMTLSPGAHSASAEPSAAPADIRAYNDFKLPFDPATLVSMSEYNLSLCLFETLFSLDDASVPHSDILESWRFNDKRKVYEFVIKNEITWSDGRAFAADDIVVSILRLRKVAPGFYKSISSLFTDQTDSTDGHHHPSLEVTGLRTLLVHVKSPGADLFNRLTGAFIPMVRDDQLDHITQRVANHRVSLGPYLLDINRSTTKELYLVANDRYFSKLDRTAKTIHLRLPDGVTRKADEVIKEDSWANLLTDRAFTTKESWDAIKGANASFWTRPVDRILYLYPVKKPAAKGVDGKKVLLAAGALLQDQPLAFEETPGAIPARSLQPKGFFLFKNLTYMPTPKILENRVFKIAAITAQSPLGYLKAKFAERGFRVEITVFPSMADMGNIQESGKYDFILMSLGAADPDPVTWLTLLLESDREFIADYDHHYRREFDEAKAEHDQGVRHQRSLDLIYRAGLEGAYLPLAHYSSIAVASRELDLSRIRQSDETVNMSKIIVKP